MMSYYLMIILWSVIFAIILNKIAERFIPLKKREPKNKEQAKAYYEYRKSMFLRWDWFLITVLLGFFSMIITIITQEIKMDEKAMPGGILFLSILFFALLRVRKTHGIMDHALEKLMKYLDDRD